MSYQFIPHNNLDRKKMLDAINKSSIKELFSQSDEILLKDGLNIPESKSEYETKHHLKELSEKNRTADDLLSFCGGGTYNHFIPSAIDSIVSRSEFYTAYTPYQPEISQGTLQMIFEFQTMMSSLTGTDYANASVYDGGTACAEAAIVALAQNRRKKVIISSALNPEYKKVVKTYLANLDVEIIEISLKELKTDFDELTEKLDKTVSCVIVPYVNYFGSIEDIEDLKEKMPQNTLLIVQVNPMYLGILKKPGFLGADIVVGDIQPFGNAMNFGGPHAGFMTCQKKYIRKMPGRVVGETVDKNGKIGYVLTLQTREQHIRREKAISNICSNQGLNVLISSVYLSLMGKQGIKEVVINSHKNAVYLSDKIDSLDNFKVLNRDNFINEFVVKCPKNAREIIEIAVEKNIVPGIDLSIFSDDMKDCLLICTTELTKKSDMDRLVDFFKEI